MGQHPAGEPPPPSSLLKRVTFGLAGGVLLVVGIALLVLPGPGLLVVLAGLLVLSQAFPSVERYVEPVADRAIQAAEESVSSPLRIAASVLGGLLLIGAGVIWGLRLFSWLPLAGWSTGSSLILSGIIVFVLLIYSYRRVQQQRASRTA